MKKNLVFLVCLITHLFASGFHTFSWGQTSSMPLIQQSDLLYLGAFRVPIGQFGGSRFGYGGTALAFNPNKNSLFIVGHDHHQQIAEISIPNAVISANTSDLPVAGLLQPFTEFRDRIPSYNLESTVKVGGLLVINNQLHGTLYEFFDAEGDAPHSHFRLLSLDLANASVEGLFRVGADINPGFVAGYMAEIPPEWQDEFGVPYLTGQAALSIIGRTSSGPAALGFDPEDLDPIPAAVTPMVYYPLSNPIAGGEWGTQNPLFNGTTTIEGVLFARGYRSVVFFGGHGIGPFCYGIGKECNDPVKAAKGSHAYPYIYQAWAYDVEDLLTVKNGMKQPWEIQPYGIWEIDLPFDVGFKRIGGVAYDAQRDRVYLSQLSANFAASEPNPVIHVFEVKPPGGTTGVIDQEDNMSIKHFLLYQNYPNPFNPSTKVSYSMPQSGWVTLKIYDLLGHELKTVVNELQTPGMHSVEIDGSKFASGVFFYKLSVGNKHVATRKMLLLK